MSDYFQWLVLAAIVLGWLQLKRIKTQIASVEARLDAVLKQLGVQWGQFSEPSDLVKQLAADPAKRIEAIRAYREQTGLGLKDAVQVIDDLAKGSTASV